MYACDLSGGTDRVGPDYLDARGRVDPQRQRPRDPSAGDGRAAERDTWVTLTASSSSVAREAGGGDAAPVAWSGYPGDWLTPNWWGRVESMTDTAWACLDLNSSVFSTDAAVPRRCQPVAVGRLGQQPRPDQYASWTEFAKQLDVELPARRGVRARHRPLRQRQRLPGPLPRLPAVDRRTSRSPRDGARRYMIGNKDVTADMLHIRYASLDRRRPRSRAARGRRGARRGRQRPRALRHEHRPHRRHPERGAQVAALDDEATGRGPATDVARGADVVDGAAGRARRRARVRDRCRCLPRRWRSSTWRSGTTPASPCCCRCRRSSSGCRPAATRLTYTTTCAALRLPLACRPQAEGVDGDGGAVRAGRCRAAPSVELNRDEYIRPGPLERAQTEEILDPHRGASPSSRSRRSSVRSTSRRARATLIEESWNDDIIEMAPRRCRDRGAPRVRATSPRCASPIG